MRLFLSIEAQDAARNGIADIFSEINRRLSFVTNKELDLEYIDNYGTEFEIISIIPTCVDDCFWQALGWKERIQIFRKKKEADIRLRMDYERFINETYDNRYLMSVEIIIKSIQAIQDKSAGDFKGDELIKDILENINEDLIYSALHGLDSTE